MKKALLRVVGPTIVGAVFVWMIIDMGRPKPAMSGLICSALLIAVIVAAPVVEYFSSQFALRDVSATILTSIILLGLFTVLWAAFEELYIYLFTKGWHEDGIGRSRYIYPDMSGMGYADGFRGLAGNLIKMMIFGAFVGTVWSCLCSVSSKFQSTRDRYEGAAKKPRDGR
ncbi:MAG: hypothetical protein AAF492_27075 [Verrucomicrobiota bacterium]